MYYWHIQFLQLLFNLHAFKAELQELDSQILLTQGQGGTMSTPTGTMPSPPVHGSGTYHSALRSQPSSLGSNGYGNWIGIGNRRRRRRRARCGAFAFLVASLKLNLCELFSSFLLLLLLSLVMLNVPRLLTRQVELLLRTPFRIWSENRQCVFLLSRL